MLGALVVAGVVSTLFAAGLGLVAFHTRQTRRRLERFELATIVALRHIRARGHIREEHIPTRMARR